MFLVKGINQDGYSVIEKWSWPLDMLAEHLLKDLKFKYAHILDQDNVLVGGVRFDLRKMRRISWVREDAAIAQSAE